MSKPSPSSQPLAAAPVYLAASALNSLIGALPAGTAYFMGIVRIPLFSGQLVHHQGSLARAAVPYVGQLGWDWPQVARALERGQVAREARFDRALTGGLACVPVDPVRLGRERRSGPARDSWTVVGLRANKKRSARLGKGDGPRAQRAVQAKLGAALRTVVRIGGVGVGVVGRPRCGATGPEAVAQVFADVPKRSAQRLFSGEAGSASSAQFRAATAREALVRRWRQLHCREVPRTLLDGVGVDDAAYQRPVVIGTTARALTTAESRIGSGHRGPSETNFFVAQGRWAREMPRAWSATAVARRRSWAVLAGALLKASAAAGAPLPLGPWDGQAVSSAGRLANHLPLQAGNFVALALQGLAPRTYRNITNAKETTEVQLPLAA